MIKIRKNLKKVTALALAAIVIGGVGYKTLKPKITPLEVESVKVKKQDIQQVLTASGEVEASSSAKLSFGTYGTITWVGVEEGETVKKYQPLASVDKKALQENLLSAQIAYQTAVTNLDKAIEAEAEIKATYRDTQETDAIRADKAQYKQAVDAARQAVATADSTRRVAEKNLSEADIVSPIDGTAIAINIKKGEEYLATSGPAIEVADLSRFKFVAKIDESEIGKISLGQKAKILLNAYEDDIFEARVTKIAPAASLDSLGNKIFKVDLDLTSDKDILKIGLEGDVDIVTSQRETLAVPWEAVVVEGSKEYVFVVLDGRAKKQEIKTGIQSADYYEVVSGLREGDLVIKSGTNTLREGARVTLK